jgi:hypothetical protein
MAIRAISIDPAKSGVTFDASHVDLALNGDGAVESAVAGGKPVDLVGLQGLIADSKSTHFTVTVKWPDGKTEGPFQDVQHINLRVNYGMNVVELLQFERLQRIWYSQKAPAVAAS